MISRVNGLVWMEGEDEDAVSWTRNNEVEPKDDDMGASLSTFKSMLEADWYVNSSMNPAHHDIPAIHNHHDIRDIGFCSNPAAATDSLLLQPLDSSSSCSPSPAFTLDPSQSQPFLPPKSCFSSLLNVCSNPFDNGFDLGCEPGFLAPLQGNHSSNSAGLMGFTGLSSQTQMGAPELSSTSDFPISRLLPASDGIGNLGAGFALTGFEGFDGSGNSLFLNRSKVLRPLEVFPSVGAQPTLFQKRAALRQSSGEGDKLGNLGFLGPRSSEVQTMGVDGNWINRLGEELEKKRNKNEEEEIDEGSIDVSGLNYDSDEPTVDELAKNGGSNSNANSTVTVGDQKGKKKGLPAKNLMAERRRRKKLNDRLYMLRSVVPKISKVINF